MGIKTLKFNEWELEVNKELTEKTYENISISGADSCTCPDCKNYIEYRDQIFPKEIINLFRELGIDYRKEVEISSYMTQENGLHYIGGYFHFKGKLLSGKKYRVPSASGNGYTFDLTEISENFEIGFAPGNDMTFFENKEGLIQIEFATNIPWVIDENLEMK